MKALYSIATIACIIGSMMADDIATSSYFLIAALFIDQQWLYLALKELK